VTEDDHGRGWKLTRKDADQIEADLRKGKL